MKKLRSVFSDDMDHCYFTGTSPVERHHIFGGSSKAASEKYGFVIPLRPDLHPNGVHAGPHSKEIDTNTVRLSISYFNNNNPTKGKYFRNKPY